MSKSENLVFTGLQIVSWIIFVGLSIEVGSLLINFIFSLFKPEFVQDLYPKLDLVGLHAASKTTFFSVYGFVIVIAGLKANLFYQVILLMQKLDLSKPFSPFVAAKISQIAYYTLGIGFLSHIAKQFSKYLSKHGYQLDNLNAFWVDSQAFILMGAIIYIIATIFKKGIELQAENDLTV